MTLKDTQLVPDALLLAGRAELALKVPILDHELLGDGFGERLGRRRLAVVAEGEIEVERECLGMPLEALERGLGGPQLLLRQLGDGGPDFGGLEFKPPFSAAALARVLKFFRMRTPPRQPETR
jgi:hypothetical protein